MTRRKYGSLMRHGPGCVGGGSVTDALVRLMAAIDHANQTLDWIEARRKTPLRPDNYARIEMDVQTVRALRGVVLTTAAGGAGDELSAE